MESSKVESSQMSRTRRAKQDAERKAAAQLERDRDTQIRVLDRGEDRTPLPLLKSGEEHVVKGVVRRGAGDRKSVTEGGNSSSQQESSQLESSQNSDTSNSTGGGDEETESSMMPAGTNDSDGSHSIERSSISQSVDQRRSEGATSDSKAGGKSYKPTQRDKFEDAGARVERPKEWTAEEKRQWLASDVTITLRETPVITLYVHQDEVVCSENADEVRDVLAKNERYMAMCETKRKDEGTKFQDRGMTTLAFPKKTIHSEIHPPSTKASGGLMVTPWRLHDEFQKLAEEDLEAEDASGKANAGADGQEATDGSGGATGGDEAADADGSGDADGGGGGEGGSQGGAARKSTAWLYSETLLPNLLVMERVVVQNMVEDLQLAYRGVAMEALRDHLPEKKIAATTGQSKKRDVFSYRAAATAEGAEGGGNEGSGANTAAASPVLDGTRNHDVDASGIQAVDSSIDPAGGDMDRTNRSGLQRSGTDGASSPTAALQPSGGAGKNKMRVLWKYGSELTAGKNVSCMCWNRKNPDILAAGYGEYGIPHPDRKYSGLVCCWSLKNPLAPERTIQIESEAGVSALSFSNHHPSLLAVGNTDGTLALYDVRKHGNTPALKTTVSTGQHTGTIWEVKWVERGKGRGENLISISADGRVLEWSIKKGLERTAPDLMKLKRMPTKNNEPPAANPNRPGMAGKSGAGTTTTREALLSRQSGGMCFDMNPKELITYVVGTEDGTLHKCSKSQSENYLLDFKPHEEPVYRIRWSPYCSQYFLTCSADWTSRLYHVDRVDPVITLDSNRQEAVHDVAWSHTNSTIFAAATSQGRVDIWDISDPMGPRQSLALENRALNCVLFAEQESPVIVVGDSIGEITVVKLCGLEYERGGLTAADQEERLQEAVRKVSA